MPEHHSDLQRKAPSRPAMARLAFQLFGMHATTRHTPYFPVASTPSSRQALLRAILAGFGMDSSFLNPCLYLVVKHQPRPIAGGNGEKMSLGLLGRKVGMMRIFTDDGDSIPVTVLDVSNNRVAQIKTPETDGYSAVQVAFGQRRASRVTKAVAGHHAKAGVEAGTMLQEFRVDAAKAAELKDWRRRRCFAVRSWPENRRARHLDR